MKTNKRPEAQIYRVDAKGVFLEALNDCFQFGRHHLRFVKYDTAQAEGSRISAQVDIFLPAAHVARWGFLFDQGAMAPLVKKSRENGKDIPGIGHSGGTGKKKLAASGKTRQDGKAEYRALSVKAGQAKDFLFQAVSGPGNEDEKGLITPAGKMDVSILVPLGMQDFFDLAWTLNVHYKGFLAGKYAPAAEEVAASIKEAFTKKAAPA